MNTYTDNIHISYIAQVVFYSKGHYPHTNDSMGDLKKILNDIGGGGFGDEEVFQVVFSTFLRYCRQEEIISRISDNLFPFHLWGSEKDKKIEVRILESLMGAIVTTVWANFNGDELNKYKDEKLVAAKKELDETETLKRKMEDEEARKQELEDDEFEKLERRAMKELEG